jgi:hypothetical protein
MYCMYVCIYVHSNHMHETNGSPSGVYTEGFSKPKKAAGTVLWQCVEPVGGGAGRAQAAHSGTVQYCTAI